MLSEIEKAFLPTEEEVKAYELRGYHITPKILPDELFEVAYEAGMAFYRGERDAGSPEVIGPANTLLTDQTVLMNNEFASLQKKEIGAIVKMPIVSAIAARLARTTEIRLFADALMCKFPQKAHDSGAFGWHTDGAYWPSCTSKHMITAWIPFQDTTIEMGPMHVIENSHTWEFDEDLKRFCAAGNKDLKEFEDYLEKKGRPYKNVPMTLKRGQMSFHHMDTFHASSVNFSDKNRMTLTIHMQDKSNGYKAAYNENGEKIVIGYERMCRKDANGDPDYRDPVFFPVLWSE